MKIRTRLMLIVSLSSTAFLIAIGVFFYVEIHLGKMQDEVVFLNDHFESIQNVRLAGSRLFTDHDLEEAWFRLDESITSLETRFEKETEQVLAPGVSNKIAQAKEALDRLGALTSQQFSVLEKDYLALLEILSSTDFYRSENISLITLYDRSSFVQPELSIDVQFYTQDLRKEYSFFEDSLTDAQEKIGVQLEIIEAGVSQFRTRSISVSLTSGFALIVVTLFLSIVFANRIAVDTTAIASSLSVMMEVQKPLAINVDRNDELGDLARRTETVFETLLNTRDQLVEREKLASLGSLVAGVSHEINTPIGTGVTASSYLQDRTVEFRRLLEAGNSTPEDLECFLGAAEDSGKIILKTLNRAAELVQSFKQVAVDQNVNERRLLDAKEYVSSLLVSLRPTFKSRAVEILLDCPEHLMMFCYPGAISQIISNLVHNALTHAYSDDASGKIGIRIEAHGKNRRIVVSDNGQGIEAENLKKLFEPFFTTARGQNGGIGLGLHIVHNLVHQSLDGTVVCQSKPGSGTSFIIDFPANLPD